MNRSTQYTYDHGPAELPEDSAQSSYVNTLLPLDAAMFHLDKGTRKFNGCSSTVSSCQQFTLACSKVADCATVYTDLHFLYSVKVMRSLRNAFLLHTDENFKKNFQKKILVLEKSVKEQAASVAVLPKLYRLVLADFEDLQRGASTIIDSIKAEAAQKRYASSHACENAQREKARFDEEAEKFDAEARKLFEEKVRWDKKKERYEEEGIRYQYDAFARKKARESAEMTRVAGEIAAGGITVGGIMGGGIQAARAARLATAVNPAALAAWGAVGAVGAVAGAAIAVKGRYDDYVAQDMEKEATRRSVEAEKHKERATQMGEECERSRKKAIEDAERAKANGENALRDGNRAARQAMHEAKECDTAAGLFNNDMIDCLSRYIQALKKVSQFFSYLASDLEKCHGEVTAARTTRKKETFISMRKYVDGFLKSCELFETFQTEVQANLPILSGINTEACIRGWCAKCEASGRLQPHETRDILHRLGLHSESQAPEEQQSSGKLQIIFRTVSKAALNSFRHRS